MRPLLKSERGRLRGGGDPGSQEVLPSFAAREVDDATLASKTCTYARTGRDHTVRASRQRMR